jgi:hypothetical protein
VSIFFHTFDGNNTKISEKKLTVDNFQTVAESINPKKSELHEIHLLFKLDTNCKIHQKQVLFETKMLLLWCGRQNGLLINSQTLNKDDILPGSSNPYRSVDLII